MQRGNSKDIVFAIEGPGASEAADSFLAIPGLHGERRAPPALTRGGELAVVIGSVLSITASASVIATQIHLWRQRVREERHAANQPPLENVTIEAPGGRIVLDHATPDQITAILTNLQSPPSSPPQP